jgi:hypothetical protein
MYYFRRKGYLLPSQPKRHNVQLATVARGSIIIGRKKIMDSQFPDEVIKRDGYVLKKPVEWI